MNIQRTNITLPQSVLDQLQMAVPSGKRSKFIAEAITEKLGKKRNLKAELRKSLKANYPLDKEFMEDWAAIEVENWPD